LSNGRFACFCLEILAAAMRRSGQLPASTSFAVSRQRRISPLYRSTATLVSISVVATKDYQQDHRQLAGIILDGTGRTSSDFFRAPRPVL